MTTHSILHVCGICVSAGLPQLTCLTRNGGEAVTDVSDVTDSN